MLGDCLKQNEPLVTYECIQEANQSPHRHDEAIYLIIESISDILIHQFTVQNFTNDAFMLEGMRIRTIMV